jgi:hypothetical protein
VHLVHTRRIAQMIEYTHEEAWIFYTTLWPFPECAGSSSIEKLDPKNLILTTLRAACFQTSAAAWEDELKPVLKNLVFETPIEDMPLLVNEMGLKLEIAKLRLRIGK